MSITRIKQAASYILRAGVVGLALAFLAIYFIPELRRGGESRPALETGAIDGVSASQNNRVSYREAVAASAPSVVNVYATKVLKRSLNPLLQDPIFRRFFGGQNQEQQRNVNLGSGVILNRDGYLVTNAHVINGADEILVTLIDGRQTRAEIVGSDPETDLALLRIQLDSLPTIAIGDSDDLNVGDVVLAIGNPYDFGQTVTQGIVSAKGRKRVGISTIEDFIQTDADINPGNSGGALINTQGQLVGINTTIISSTGGSQGIGLAIPIKLVFDVVQQLLNHGRVIRGYVGIMAESLPPGTLDTSGQEQTGVLVAAVMHEGPAALAGIIPGDIITEINHIQIYDISQAFQIISGLRPGTVVDIAVIRGWEEMILSATITDKPPITAR
jgi:serine protease DegS